MNPKIIIITSNIPYPLSEGGKISQFAFLDYLQYSLNIKLLLVANSKQEEEDIITLKNLLPKVNIEYSINYTKQVYTPIKEKITLKKIIKKIYYLISDKITKPKKPEIKPIKKEETVLSFPFNFNILNKNIINDFIKTIDDFNPDIIQIEHNLFIGLIHAIPKKYKTVFVEHEIQYEKIRTQNKISESNYEKYILELTGNIERSLLNEYSLVLTFSEEDKKHLEKHNVKTLIESSPFPILDNAFDNNSTNNIEKIVFIGGEGHPPNKDALEWYLNTMSLEIYNKTSLKIHIIGNWSNDFKEKYNQPHIIFDGYVENLKINCHNSLMIVPLRIGSGIRTKILYGIAQSLPIVSTNVGCEGIGLKNMENILIADDTETFIKHIIDLKNNNELSEKIATNAYKFAKNNFSQESLSNKRLKIYFKLINNEF